MQTTQIEIMAGHFGKVTNGGKTVARANANKNGTWSAYAVSKGSESAITLQTSEVAAWLALQALAYEFS